MLHTDAVQAFPWLDVAALAAPADLVAVSAHKFGGPKGVGALVVRGGTVEPLLVGGGQERDRRSGTHNVAGIVAMAAAMRVTVDTRDETVARIGALRDRPRRRVDGRRPGAARDRHRGDRQGGRLGARVHSRASRARRCCSCSTRRHLRVGRLGVRQRCHGAVARARGHGRAEGIGGWFVALVARLGHRPTPTSTSRSRSSPAAVRRLGGEPLMVSVLVAMSGGVDSSVAAALLLDEGHDVVGVTMKLWGGESDTGCCSVADVDDARRVAQQLGIDHHVFNFTDDFDATWSSPTSPPTPPAARRTRASSATATSSSIACSSGPTVLGFDAVATGHHARVVAADGRFRLERGADSGQGPVLRAAHARPGRPAPHPVPRR